jgi:solute carrier family 25 carnitine/acylcarnitine transporter 20/29
MKKIYKQYGLRGIYRGTPVTLVREAITFGTYFSVYAAMIDFFQSRSKDGELGMGEVILSGAVAGITLWPLCFPFDVIKTKLQTDSFTEPKFKNARDCARQIYSTFGWRGFFKGIAPCMLRAGPVNGGTFAAYTLAFNSLMLLQPQYQYA